MNERIKELMGQTLDEKFAGTWSVMDLQDLTKFADRFAELIVKECISTLEEKIHRSIDNEGDEIWADLILKEHFGVDES
jgi:hypothetical protein